jgi:hypothetical protein
LNLKCDLLVSKCVFFKRVHLLCRYSKDPRVQVFGRMIGVAQPLPADACGSLLGFLSQLFRLTGGA